MEVSLLPLYKTGSDENRASMAHISGTSIDRRMASSSPESPLRKKAKFLPLDASIFPSDGMLHGKDNLTPKPRNYQEAEFEKLTNNYDEKYFIGRTQFGKLYRGKIDSHVNGAESRYVTVKIWDENRELLYTEACCNVMFNEEVRFLSDPTVNYHPNLVKFIGYCPGEVKGVVYDLDPKDTLHNLTTKGYGQCWEAWSDVFSFGIVLLGTIAKRVLEENEICHSDTPLTDEWAKIEYKDGCSLVHWSLAEDPCFEESDGTKITALGMQCIDNNPERRPTMEEAVKCLESLLVVQRHADALGI